MRHVLLIGLLLLATTPARAQERHGFWFNGGLGYGSLGCDNCDSREGGLSGGISLGGTLSPHWLLGVGTTGWTKEEGGVRLTTGTVDARVRFYPSRTGNFFLTGGLGVGEIRASGFGSSASETGWGAVLGLGYDIRIGNSLSLTPFWNGFAVRNDQADANVGQLGLSLTVHKFRELAPPEPSEVTPSPGYRLVEPPRQAPPPAAAPAPAPAPSVQPRPQPERAVEPAERPFPPGIAFVGDTRLMLYYPVQCARQKAIPAQFQVLFQTRDGAARDGFKPSGDC